MRWKDLFTPTILIRGKDYYRRDKVKSLIPFGDYYRATVEGSRIYTVTIQQKDGKLFHANCDCPHSQSGYFCKHIAAVLFAIDEYEEYESIGEVHPFDEMYQDAGDDYRYFDIRRMTSNLVIFQDTYQRAQRLLKNNQITDVSLSFRSAGDDGMICDIKGVYMDSSYPCCLSMRFDRNGMIESSCEKCIPGYGVDGCRIHGDRNEPNQYLLALLLIAGRKLIDDPNAGDSTSGTGMKLLQAFRDERASALSPELRREIRLEPRLTRNNGELSVSVRAGEDKLYVVKDLTDFVTSVERKRLFTIGKTEYNFSRDYVRESDRALYQFVRTIVCDAKIRDNWQIDIPFVKLTGTNTVKNSIELFGSRTDSFFDAVEGTLLRFTDVLDDGKVNSELSVCEGAPDVSLDVRKYIDKDGVFHGITASVNSPALISGSEHHYYLESGRFCRISAGDEKRLAPLLEMMRGGDFSFKVGRNNLAEFCYTVLPRLRGMVTVREHDPEIIREYLPPEAELVFYLDNDNGKLTCRASARYGENEFLLSGDTSVERSHSDVRDFQREAEALEVVRTYFAHYDKESGLFCCEESDDAAYRLLSEGVSELLRLGEVNCTDSFRSLHIRRRIPLKVGVSVSGDLMNLTIESDDVSMKELAGILKSYRKKKKYHRLKNGDFVDIDETIAELSDIADAARLTSAELAAGSMNLPLYRALYLDRLSEKCEALRVSRDSMFRRIVKEFKTVSESDFEIPEHLRGIMRNYQIFGYRWLRTLDKFGFGGILADDMGLGKTLQIISVLCAAKAEGGAGTSLVVCPASLIYNWMEEIRRFAPELNAIAIAGNQFERADMIEAVGRYDVAVTSYDLLKRDIALYEKIRFRYEIIDEAQYIKNHSTAAAKAVKVIHSGVRFALTGTPIENRLSELWSIFDYLMPGFLYGYETFRKELETPIARNADPKATEKLRRMTSPFILRRLKGDVLKDLPDKIEEVRYAAFDDEQRRLYDAQVAHMKGMLEESGGEQVKKNKIQILAELTRLRQICCDPSLVFEDYKGGSAKRAVCVELIRSAIEGEHKVLLFSQFTSMLELLESDLRSEGIAYCKITGATPKQERVELVRKFNGDDTPVFLISLKAGGTGLNLTGADVVIHYDPWWNLAAQNQATDRAHRIGQTRIVSVFRIIAHHSVEEKILELQESKQDLADEILSGELGTIGSMSREELLALLE